MSGVFLIIFFSLVNADREAMPVGPLPTMDLCQRYAQQVNHGREAIFAQCVWMPPWEGGKGGQ
jgi:hypothetical protein